MPQTGRYGNVDYARWAKGGFLFGLAMFVVGTGGEYLLVQLHRDIPEVVHVVLIDLGLVGILFAVLLPIIFGVVMPLTE